jgi:hypothetical protein
LFLWPTVETQRWCHATAACRGAAPADIIEALAGIALEPDDMRALVAGCALGNGEPADGRSFERGWASVETGDATVFLRQVENQWRVAGLRRGSLSVEYSEFTGGHPATVHLRTIASQNVAAADLTIHISQREANVPLETAVFSVDVPKDAAPLTLEELRRAGPLGGGTPDGTEAAEDTGRDQHGDTEGRRHGGIRSRAGLRPGHEIERGTGRTSNPQNEYEPLVRRSPLDFPREARRDRMPVRLRSAPPR